MADPGYLQEAPISTLSVKYFAGPYASSVAGYTQDNKVMRLPIQLDSWVPHIVIRKV